MHFPIEVSEKIRKPQPIVDALIDFKQILPPMVYDARLIVGIRNGVRSFSLEP